MEDKGKPIMYTCYTCLKNFRTKKCPQCGGYGTPIYEKQANERPKNNPTDIDAFFKRKKKKSE